MKKFQAQRKNARRRGVVAIYVALTIVLMLGAGALGVDVSYMYFRRAQVQRAADAAALAGAYALSFPTGTAAGAETKARALATANGFTDSISGTVVQPIYPVPGNTSWYRVNIQRLQPLFFAGVLGFKSANVGASATATFTAAVIDIPTATTDYGADFVGTGANVPVYNFSVFGPQAYHSWGDNLSTQRLNNGDSNPEYNAPNDSNVAGQSGNTLGGYNFIFNPGTMTGNRIQLELYDPCTTIDQSSSGIDEIKSDGDYNSNKGGPKPNSPKTTTEYSVYSDNGTPNNLLDDTLIARTYYGGANQRDTDAAMKWVTPDGKNKAAGSGNPYVKDDIGNFTFNKLGPAPNGQPVKYRINVVTLDGASENGFSIRGGPERTAGATFDKNNGSSISARGIIPVNFNKDGQASFTLGYVPSNAANSNLKITKFDTDITPANGSTNTVYYMCVDAKGNAVTPQASKYASTLPGAPANAFAGVGYSGNDGLATDTIPLPANYPGGTWTAFYNAGKSDTSTWKVETTGSGTPGSIQLVQ